jgi:hypothetical protein
MAVEVHSVLNLTFFNFFLFINNNRNNGNNNYVVGDFALFVDFVDILWQVFNVRRRQLQLAP